MPGMQVPEPGGSMKKMQFEFSDPAEQQMQAAQAQAQSAAILPSGAGGGMPADQGQPEMQDPSQGGAGSLFGGMAGGADQFGQGPDSSMFSDDQLAAMVGDEGMGGPMNPIDMEAEMLESQLAENPELQMQMMMAARRMGGF